MLDQIIDEGVGYLSPRQGSRFIAPTTNGPVGADLSRPSPIYRPQVNTSNPITASETIEGVGADLSRPSPIYRPQVNTSNSIITSETIEGVGADLSRPSPIYRPQVNTSNPITASETIEGVGADLSRPSPIYRPQVNTSNSIITSETTEGVGADLSRPSPIYRPQVNTSNSIITSETTEIDSEQTHYVVRLPAFEGPLNLLLYLIEKRQMEITTISLVAVTDQYLAYLHSFDKSGSYRQDEAADSPPLANMAAFIFIAARLLYIKSQSLLPTTSKEEPGAEVENAITMADELRRHLLEYKAAKEIAHHLRKREEAGLQTYERTWQPQGPRPAPLRPLPLPSIEAQLAWAPPTLIGVEPQALAQVFQHLLQRRAKEELNGTSLLPLARVSVRDRS